MSLHREDRVRVLRLKDPSHGHGETSESHVDKERIGPSSRFFFHLTNLASRPPLCCQGNSQPYCRVYAFRAPDSLDPVLIVG